MSTIAVLAAFLESPEDERYGLELARFTGLLGGTLYPILDRLEEQLGWLSSRMEDIDPAVEGRRPRRYYRLTALGGREAKAAVLDAQRQTMGRPVGANYA